MKTNTSYPGELWQTTHKWLLLSGNKINKKYCSEEISTHPDYPAMTAVTDFLDTGNMTYNAVQADASYIHEFNYPVLAHIRQPGQEYMHIITHATEWDRQKDITQYWTGITLFPEKDAKWGNEENNIYQKNAFKNRLFITALILTGIGVFIFSAFKASNAGHLFFGLFSLAGLITSIVLLGTELGYQSQIVKQVCGAVSNGGCEKVLKSKYAKGWWGITPADASVLYFGSQFIFYLISSFYTNLFSILLLMACVGSIVAAWSIYTQAFKIKQWRAICLGIVGVLILQAVLALLILNYKSLVLYSLIPFLLFISTIFILALALLPVKSLININQGNRQKLAELKKWKTDVNLFTTQWQQEQHVDNTIWQNDLVLGNPDALILITVACNPYCGPCAKAHKELDKMLKKFDGKMAVQVRLLCNPENENDKRTIAVNAIIQQVAIIKNNKELQQMLTDWFEWMDFEKWIEKWQVKNDIDIKKSVLQHSDWVNESSIAFTPTFFINGKKLPGRYELNDLEILLPQLVEILKENTVK